MVAVVLILVGLAAWFLPDFLFFCLKFVPLRFSLDFACFGFFWPYLYLV